MLDPGPGDISHSDDDFVACLDGLRQRRRSNGIAQGLADCRGYIVDGFHGRPPSRPR